MADDKPPPRLGDFLNQFLTMAENDPDQFVEGLKAYKDALVENSGEAQRRVRNTAIKGLARFARAKLTPEDEKK